MKAFFSKELVSNQFMIGGAPVQFEILDGNEGVISLDTSSPLFAALNLAASEHRGGIVRITEEMYAQKKTAQPFRGYAKDLSRQDEIRLARSNNNPFAKEPGVAAATSNPPAIPLQGANPIPPASAGFAAGASASPAGEVAAPAGPTPSFRPATRRGGKLAVAPSASDMVPAPVPATD